MAVGDLQWEVDKPAISESNSDIDGVLTDNQTALQRLFAKRIHGCKLIYNSATSVDIDAGDIAISDGTNYRFRSNSSSITVTLSSADATSIYYIYAVADSSTSTNFTGEIVKQGTSPNGTYTRYIGSVATDGGGDIISFWCWGASNDRRLYYQDHTEKTFFGVGELLVAGTWYDQDCSAVVPSNGAWAIWLHSNAAASTGTPTYSIRENGETNTLVNFLISNSLRASTFSEVEVPLDTNAIAERKITALNTNSWSFHVGGFRDFV